MNPVIFHEAAIIWQQISSGVTSKHADFEIDIYKRLLNIFQVGDYYYYIFNLQELKFDLMSKEIKTVLGYNPEDVDLPGLLSKIHPEDHPWFLNFENKVIEFFGKLAVHQIPNYKVRYDYRIKKSDGTYIRILQQVVTIDYDESGRLLRTFGVHTDISHLKTEGRPLLSFIGLNGEPSYINVTADNLFKKPAFALTPRERDILIRLADGKGSKEIASELCISKDTVNTHRKNILAKTEASNTPELIMRATREGWI